MRTINEDCLKTNGLPSFVGKSGSEMRVMFCDAKYQAKSTINNVCTKKASAAVGINEDKETEKSFAACKAMMPAP